MPRARDTELLLPGNLWAMIFSHLGPDTAGEIGNAFAASQEASLDDHACFHHQRLLCKQFDKIFKKILSWQHEYCYHPALGLGCTDAYNIRVRVYTGVHTCPR